MSHYKGWISLHRNIRDHWLYKEKRKFSRFEAWVDLLMSVNHKDNKILFGSKLLEIKRGQVLTSEVKLSKRWDWSRKKVRNFLELLESDEMILKIVIPNRGTIIEILNYDEYQKNTSKDTTVSIDNASIEEEEEQQATQPKNNQETTKEQPRNTNNNDNNVNNDNKSLCMYDENLKNIVKLLEDNIGVVPPILIDEVNKYSKTFDIKMFSEAIKIAARNKKRNINYVLGILRNWRDNNILTIDDLEAFRREKEIERKEKQQKYKNKKQYRKPKTRFHNFEQRTDSYTEDDLEAIAERKRQEYIKNLKKAEDFSST